MAAPIVKFLLRNSYNFARFSTVRRYYTVFKKHSLDSSLAGLSSSLQRLSLNQPRSIHHLCSPVNPTAVNSTNVAPSPLVKPSSSSRPRVSLLVPARNRHRGKCVVTCSRKRGAFMTNKEVPKRFYRLRSGLWIRTICGKKKHLWKKSRQRVWDIKQHVFCDEKQNVMLDKMVSSYYKKPRHWVNNIYEPYEERTGVTEGFRVPQRPFYP